jgi:hypothetical protein
MKHYLIWDRKYDSGHDKQGDAVRIVLYALARTTSMNAKVAKTIEKWTR